MTDYIDLPMPKKTPRSKAPSSIPTFADIYWNPYSIRQNRRALCICMGGDPVPGARARVTRRGVFYPERQVTYRKRLQSIYMGHGDPEGNPTFPYYSVNLKFNSTIMPAKGGFGVRAFFYKRNRQRMDVDNLLKMVMDAGNGILWEDDSQVMEAFGRIYVEPARPRIVVLIYHVEGDPALTRSMDKICTGCGKIYTPKNSERYYTQKYCTSKCWSESNRTEIVCAFCKELFTVPNCYVPRRRDKYCSRSCAAKGYWVDNPRSSSNWKCQECGKGVSRKEYSRCHPCSMKIRKPKTKNTQFAKVKRGKRGASDL